MLTSIHDLLLIEKKTMGNIGVCLEAWWREWPALKYSNGKSCFFHTDLFTTLKLLSNVWCRHRGKSSEADMMNIWIKYSFYSIEYLSIKMPPKCIIHRTLPDSELDAKWIIVSYIDI